MKTSAIVASLLLGASASKSVAIDSKMKLITEGILKGALDAEGFSDIEHCIQDGEKLVQDAEAAYKDFSKHSVSDIINGLKEVADAVRVIKAGMKDCSSMKADWAKLDAMAKNFESPTSLAWHIARDLVVNGKDIYREISTAIGDYKSQDWLGFGTNVGMAAAKTLLGEEQPTELSALSKTEEQIMLAQATMGFGNEFGAKFDMWHLLVCIQDEDEALMGVTIAVEAVEKAVNEWKAGDRQNALGDFIGSLMSLKFAQQQATAGIPECESIIKKEQEIEKMMSTVNFDRIDKSGDDIRVDGESIMGDLDAAMTAFKAKNYNEFGRLIGKITKLIATEKKQPVEKFEM